jgi:hypothetical protein
VTLKPAEKSLLSAPFSRFFNAAVMQCYSGYGENMLIQIRGRSPLRASFPGFPEISRSTSKSAEAFCYVLFFGLFFHNDVEFIH